MFFIGQNENVFFGGKSLSGIDPVCRDVFKHRGFGEICDLFIFVMSEVNSGQ